MICCSGGLSMTAIRIIVVLESSVIAFFEYFLYQQYVNDQYFQAYLHWQNLDVILGVGMATLAFLVGGSIYIACVQRVPVVADLLKEKAVKPPPPGELPKSKPVDPETQAETKLVIP